MTWGIDLRTRAGNAPASIQCLEPTHHPPQVFADGQITTRQLPQRPQSRTERRIRQCWEATRAPTQWPRPIDRGDASASPFIRFLAESSASGEAPSDKSWGCGGKAPAAYARPQSSFRNRAPSDNACFALLASVESYFRLACDSGIACGVTVAQSDSV